MGAASAAEEAQVERLNGVTDAMTSSITTLKEHVNLITGATSQEQIVSKVSSASAALSEMAESVSRMRDEMKALVDSETKAVQGLREQYEATVDNIRTQNQAVKSELDSFRGLTAETHRSLIELARALKEAV